MNWQSGNIVVDVDAAENIKMNKKKAAEKIDGMVSLVMAIGCSMAPGEVVGPSIYETRGILTM